MRKDTTFSDRKLTRAEFCAKYWHNGDFPYQYHTAEIEDARDEREQFVFNNIRALRDLGKEYQTINYREHGTIHDHLERLDKKTTALVAANAVAGGILLAIIIALRYKIGNKLNHINNTVLKTLLHTNDT